ncbi:Hypothetical predicted protein [Mytilus galloprovincialis]|uniref:Immunoglobulin subtype domain-containing protein n=1 Tax=Mytilus galloprovincialis TaxID=29158 RepID=A0A8B6DVY4_MYTGA|nr:Hypothetical predicted protein [Mytilus galloprovincialis]
MEWYMVILFVKVLGMLYMQSCKASVCLTWTVETGSIVFRCKTDELVFPVVFFSPTGKEIGFCNVPVPTPLCTPIMPNILIKQDMRTHTTILIYKGKIDSSMDGKWKCQHGSNVESSTVNITVLLKDAVANEIKNDPLTKNQENGICSSPIHAILGSICGFCGTLQTIWVLRVFKGVTMMFNESYKRRLSGITANKLKRYNTRVVGFTIFYVFGSVVAVLISVLTDMYTYVQINVHGKIQDSTPQA